MGWRSTVPNTGGLPQCGTTGSVNPSPYRPFFGVPPPAELPPERVSFDLEEALYLFAALEDSRDVLIETDHFDVLSKSRIRSSSGLVSLALIKGDSMFTELLRASEAARRLEISTKELLTLVYGREVRYELVDGIAHISTDALEEHQAQSS